MEASKEIYLVRHGETDYNRQGIIQGQAIDSHLNETGQWQAQAFHRQYGQVPFCGIYTSQLRRTRQSVQRFLANGTPGAALAALDEINWGACEGKPGGSPEHRQLREVLALWNTGDYQAKAPGGESVLEVAARQRPFVDLLKSEQRLHRWLVCMHGRAMRILLCTLFGLPYKEMEQFGHHNMCLYHVRWEGGRPHLLKENCIRHLQQAAGLNTAA